MPVDRRREMTPQATSPVVRWALVGVAAVIGVVLLAWLVFQIAPDLFTSGQSKGFTAADEAGARADVRTSALQFLGGLLLALGAVYTARTFRLNREGQITERFTAAVAQLAHTDPEVRVGGIYALGRIARQSREFHDAVIQVLTAFARNHAPWQAEQESVSVPMGLDMQAVMWVLRSRDPKYRRLEDRLVLRDVDLHTASLTGADLTLAWLSHADLREARLVWTKLERARLGGADLRGALIAGADLRNAYLRDATLVGADLRGADLAGADLVRADVRDAHLRVTEVTPDQLRRGVKGALDRERWLIDEFDDKKVKRYCGTVIRPVNLREARLMWTKLERARLGGADLTGALMAGADLRNAYLRDATLVGADLRGADLRGADLRGADLSNARRHGTAVTPDELRRVVNGAVEGERWFIDQLNDEELKRYCETVAKDAQFEPKETERKSDPEPQSG
jgi:uncharacterized protein YjbI with pentapeptide repeats